MLNVVILSGRILKTPVLQETENGIEYTTFQLAVDRDYKNEDGKKDTDIISCTAWRRNAIFITENFDGGSMINLRGVLETTDEVQKDGSEITRRTMVNVVQYWFGETKRARFDRENRRAARDKRKQAAGKMVDTGSDPDEITD